MNDSVIAAQIAAENLLIPIVDPAPTSPRESVQQTGSDWAFLKELRAAQLLRGVRATGTGCTSVSRVRRPKMIVLEWGRNLSSFSPRLSTSAQFGIQVLRGYDYKLAQDIVADPAGGGARRRSRRTSSSGSAAASCSSSCRSAATWSAAPRWRTTSTRWRWPSRCCMQMLEGLYEGSGTCIGMPQLRAGDHVEIQGVGKRFSGHYKLSKVTHTHRRVRLHDAASRCRRTDNSALLQSLRKKLNESPSPNRQEPRERRGGRQGREQRRPRRVSGASRCRCPSLSDVNLSDWARICAPMAGDASGAYFLPDIGDEVLVTFEHGNIDKPIVLGGLWNGTERGRRVQNEGLNAKKVHEE